MSKRLDVLQAIGALIQAALPNAEVITIDDDEAAPTRLAPGGRAVIRSGDPGDPDVTLGVLTYTYSHRIPVELTAYPSATLSKEQVLDAMGAAIGGAVAADRTLGGLAEWLEAEAMTTDDYNVPGAPAARAGDLALIADYTTSNPLT